MKKNLDMRKSRHSEQILQVPWPFVKVRFHCSTHDADLPTPITCKSGGFEKSPEKPGDWDLKPGDFQNMHQIRNNNNRLFV